MQQWKSIFFIIWDTEVANACVLSIRHQFELDKTIKSE